MPARFRPLCAAAFAALAFGLGVATPAHAEKADRDKPVNIEADRMTYDDLKQVNVFEGHVVLTQGTLVIRADKLTVKQDPEGFQSGIADKGTGGLAYFRQKRDGVDEYIEGWGEQITYDAKSDHAKLITRARLLRNGDEALGDVINYDGRTEFYTVVGKPNARDTGDTVGGKPPVRLTIMPKTAGGDSKTVPGKAEPGKAGAPKADAGKGEAGKGGASKGDTNKGDAAKSDSAKSASDSSAPGGNLNLKPSGIIAAPRETYPEPPAK
ncbi:MAG TPA: lipopolysaccharide transport periplasmic protein LptA [Burkholderiales bacterium]